MIEARERIIAASCAARGCSSALSFVAGAAGGGGASGRRPGSTDPARGPVLTQPAPAIPREATIKAVEAAAQAGYDYLKVVLNTTRNGPEVETLKLIVSEGKKHNLPTIVHAVSVRDTLAALEARPQCSYTRRTSAISATIPRR